MIVQNKTGTVQVRKLLNGTTLDPTQDGNNPAGATAVTYVNLEEQPNNKLCEAFGKRYLLVNDDVRERDEGGSGNWGIVHTTVSAPGKGGRAVSGLHLLHPNGIPTLAFFFERQSNHIIYLVTSTNGTTWNETATGTGAPSNNLGKYGRSIVFGSSLFWTVRWNINTGYIWSWNLSTGVATTYLLTSGVFGTIGGIEPNVPYFDFIVHKDKLYCTTRNDSNGGYLFRLDGTTWVNVMGGTASWTSSWTTLSPSVALISDGDDLVILSSDAGSVRATRFQTPETTATATAITSPVWDNIDTNSNSHMYKYLDVSDPTSGTWYIWQGTSAGINSGTFDCYQYNGVSSAMTFVGNGVPGSTFTIPSIGDGGSDRIPAKGEGRPEFDGLPTEQVNGRKRFFRVYGTGSALTLSLYYSADQEAPGTLATLVASTITIESGSPSTTPTNTASQITNLTPDDGATLYSVVHDVASDGLSVGEQHTVLLDVV
jgi:hypothetical protein